MERVEEADRNHGLFEEAPSHQRGTVRGALPEGHRVPDTQGRARWQAGSEWGARSGRKPGTQAAPRRRVSGTQGRSRRPAPSLEAGQHHAEHRLPRHLQMLMVAELAPSYGYRLTL